MKVSNYQCSYLVEYDNVTFVKESQIFCHLYLSFNCKKKKHKTREFIISVISINLVITIKSKSLCKLLLVIGCFKGETIRGLKLKIKIL